MTTIGLFAVAVGAVILFLLRQLRQQSDIRRLQDRPSTDFDAIYSKYYARDGYAKESVLEVWREIANVLNVPPEKLRPSDRFGRDVGRDSITTEKLDALHVHGVRRAKHLRLNPNFEQITTVDDYVRTLSARENLQP